MYAGVDDCILLLSELPAARCVDGFMCNAAASAGCLMPVPWSTAIPPAKTESTVYSCGSYSTRPGCVSVLRMPC